jgi:hypothetical protein
LLVIGLLETFKATRGFGPGLMLIFTFTVLLRPVILEPLGKPSVVMARAF